MAQRGLTPYSTTAPMPMTPPDTPGFLIAERFALDHSADLPVGAQLHWQLRTFIRTGQARGGEALEKARAAGVEPREFAVALHAVSPAPLPDVRRDSDQRGARAELRRQI